MLLVMARRRKLRRSLAELTVQSTTVQHWHKWRRCPELSLNAPLIRLIRHILSSSQGEQDLLAVVHSSASLASELELTQPPNSTQSAYHFITVPMIMMMIADACFRLIKVLQPLRAAPLFTSGDRLKRGLLC